MKALGKWLEDTGTTQTAFARLVDLSQPTVANLVNGVHSASSEVLKRIARVTGLTVDQLLADETSVPPKGRRVG